MRHRRLTLLGLGLLLTGSGCTSVPSTLQSTAFVQTHQLMQIQGTLTRMLQTQQEGLRLLTTPEPVGCGAGHNPGVPPLPHHEEGQNALSIEQEQLRDR